MSNTTIHLLGASLAAALALGATAPAHAAYAKEKC